MRRLIPYLILFAFAFGSYYYKDLSDITRKLVKEILGVLFIVFWIYLILRFL